MPVESIYPEGIGPLTQAQGRSLASGAQPAQGFKEMFTRYLEEVNALQVEADKAVRDLVVGKTDNLHEVIASMSEAGLSFNLMMQIRNRLVEAYKEIMRMQV